MGKVYRPTALSPMTSWKSWAWIVVARMAAITDIEKAPGKSSWRLLEANYYAQSKRYDFMSKRKREPYLQPKSIQLQNRHSQPSSSSSSKANVDRHAFRGTGGWEQINMHWIPAHKDCRSRTTTGMWQSSCIWEWIHWQELCDRTATVARVYCVHLLPGRVLGSIGWTGVREARPTGGIVWHGKLDEWATRAQRPQRRGSTVSTR